MGHALKAIGSPASLIFSAPGQLRCAPGNQAIPPTRGRLHTTCGVQPRLFVPKAYGRPRIAPSFVLRTCTVVTQLPGSYAADPESTHASNSSLLAFFGSRSWLAWQMNSFPSRSFTQTRGSVGFVASMVRSFRWLFVAFDRSLHPISSSCIALIVPA